MSALCAPLSESQALSDLPIAFPKCLNISSPDLFPRDILSRSQACRCNDAALRPFLEAESEREAQRCLEALMEQAAPIIARIIRQIQHTAPNRAGGRYQKQEEQEADDTYQDAIMLVITRLRALRNEGSQSPIARFSAYVAATAAHVCHERLRRAHPNRQACRDRLRYLLTSAPGVAVWRDDWGRSVCGLSGWQGRPASRAALLRLRAFQEDPARLEADFVSPLNTCLDRSGLCKESRFAQDGLADEMPFEAVGESLWEGTLNGEGLTALLGWLGGPVTPQYLTTALITVLGVKEITPWTPPDSGEDAHGEDALMNREDRRVNIAREVEQRDFLRRLWQEVTSLPPLQRAALLLNLRDGQGRGALALLAHTRTASAAEIAASLPLPAERLTDAWPALPLEDACIAQILGVTRQQVINLRKVARARLTRRLREASACS